MKVFDKLKAVASNVDSMLLKATAPKPKKMPGVMYNQYGQPMDLNNNQIPDYKEKPKFKEVNLMNPALDTDKDISRDKRGHYVSTITYPLPPVKWEKKQHDQNRRLRNKDNKYL